MTDTTWLEITLSLCPDDLDQACAQLAQGDMTALVIEDEGEFHEFLTETQAHWDFVDQALLEEMKHRCRIKFYATDDQNGRDQLAQHTAHLTFPYEVTQLLENDWAYSWQKYYKPLEIGKALYIVPEWERESPLPQGKTPCYLNPGLTFGTGAHASTQLCLEGVEALCRPGDLVLDLGCGSGILSIMALILGAKQAWALDIDPLTRDVAYENASYNQITQDRYTVLTGNILEDDALKAQIGQRSYPLILANIVADVILPLAPLAKEWLSPGGHFLCSGIIDSRAQEVADALESLGFTQQIRREKKGWVSIQACLE